MKIESVAGALVALVICVVVIALVAIPVVQDSTQGTPYEGSNLVYDYKVIYIEESPTFTWTSSAKAADITYNGQTDTGFLPAKTYTVATDKILVKHSIANGGHTVLDLTNNTVTTFYGTCTLAVSNGSYTLTMTPTGESASTLTGTVSWALVPSDLGTWGHYADPSVKVTLEQTVFFGNFATSSGVGPVRLVSSTDGSDATSVIAPFTYGGSTITAASEVTYDIGFQQTGGNQAVGLYGPVTSSWTSGGTPASTTAIETFAPLSYESTEVGEGVASGTDSMLLAVIPILLIIVAIMVAVRVMKDA